MTSGPCRSANGVEWVVCSAEGTRRTAHEDFVFYSAPFQENQGEWATSAQAFNTYLTERFRKNFDIEWPTCEISPTYQGTFNFPSQIHEPQPFNGYGYSTLWHP
jgi:hypothetical protein